MKNLLALALILAPVAVPYAAHAQTPTATICSGQYIEECQSRYGKTAFTHAPGCNAPADMVQSICTLKGSKTKVDFYTQNRNVQPGNQCGYALIDVFCQWNMPIK